jgi:hypothetical protein
VLSLVLFAFEKEGVTILPLNEVAERGGQAG